MIRIGKVLIIGGGAAGCTAALRICEAGIPVCLAEREKQLGGHAAAYGCKAGDACVNCGVCLTGPLWDAVREKPGIELLLNTRPVDLRRVPGGFSMLAEREGIRFVVDAGNVFLASGFSQLEKHDGANTELPVSPRILTGYEAESRLKASGKGRLFPETPRKIGFILCVGSRAVIRGAAHCSKVCCAYSMRMAKLLLYLYPETKITFFYMDLQEVKPRNIRDELARSGVRFIRCRPAGIGLSSGGFPVVRCESGNESLSEEFDYIIRCTGIRPNGDNGLLAELLTLRTDKDGFLQTLRPPEETGVWLAGTVRGPLTIAETAADARGTADRLLRHLKGANAVCS